MPVRRHHPQRLVLVEGASEATEVLGVEGDFDALSGLSAGEGVAR